MGSKVYGKNPKRIRKAQTQLEPPIEFSPTKNQDKLNSGITRHDEFDLRSDKDSFNPTASNSLSPVSSPRRSLRRVLVSPRHSSSTSKNSSTSSSLNAPKEQSFVEESSSSSLKSQRSTTPKQSHSPSLNRYFVESTAKPTWSPSLSPSNSQTSTPNKVETSIGRSPQKLTKRRLEFGSKSNTEETNTPFSSQDNDPWDLLNDVRDQSPRKSKPLLKKLSQRSKSSSILSLYTEEEPKLEELFESLSRKENVSATPKQTEQIETDSFNRSPGLKRSLRTYGSFRSYKATQDTQIDEEGVRSEHKDEQDDDSISDSIHDGQSRTKDDDNLQSVTNLRAQGENAQYIDEFRFIMDGISTKNILSRLLDLAINVLEPKFLKVLKNQDLSILHNYINTDDSFQCYLFIFILREVSKDSSNSFVISGDDFYCNIFNTLIANSQDFKVPKLSKSNKATYDQFQKRTDKEYSLIYLTLHFLIQSTFDADLPQTTFLIDSIIEGLVFKNIDDQETKRASLVIIERYLSESTQIPSSKFKKLTKLYISNDYESEDTITILLLKITILLAVKKFKQIYQPQIAQRSIDQILKTQNEEILILNLGLLINLIDDQRCLSYIKKKSTIESLYSRYSDSNQDTLDYFALLIGIIYASDSIIIKSIFSIDELSSLHLRLQKFNFRGNKSIELQVSEVLSNFNV